MSQAHHHTENLEKPDKLELPQWFYGVSIALVVVGAATFFYGVFGMEDPTRAWKSYLLGFFFFTMLAICGPFLVATQYLTRAGWGVTVRRIPEAFGTFLIPAGVLGIILILGGADVLYEWTICTPENAAACDDKLLAHKLPYLNVERMLWFSIVGFAILAGLGWFLAYNSRKQDETGDRRPTQVNARLSALFCLAMAAVITVLSVDYVMSLHPHWFSTMWGVNIWSSMFHAGLALVTIIALVLYKKGIASDFIKVDHIHDLAKMTFAMTAFWAYITFCQYLLIWYANLPEEAIFYNARMEHGWEYFTVLLPLVKFVIPFFLLLPRGVKRAGKLLGPICVWILLSGLFEAYWWIAPAPSPEHHHFSPAFPWMELLVFAGFGGLFALVVGWTLTRYNLIPIKDPRLKEALHHHI